MTSTAATTPEQEARRRKTVIWVVALAFVGLLFDGYDLVVYGTVLSTFLRDPSQIGEVTPAVGGALGSAGLIGGGGYLGAVVSPTPSRPSSGRTAARPALGGRTAWLVLAVGQFAAVIAVLQRSS